MEDQYINQYFYELFESDSEEVCFDLENIKNSNKIYYMYID